MYVVCVCVCVRAYVCVCACVCVVLTVLDGLLFLNCHSCSKRPTNLSFGVHVRVCVCGWSVACANAFVKNIRGDVQGASGSVDDKATGGKSDSRSRNRVARNKFFKALNDGELPEEVLEVFHRAHKHPRGRRVGETECINQFIEKDENGNWIMNVQSCFPYDAPGRAIMVNADR